MKISPQCSCAFHPPPSQGTWNHPSPSTQPCICFENLKFSICFEMFPPNIFCKVLLFVLKCFIQAFFIKFHWTQHVFENTFKNDNDATLPVWKKEKSSKTNARAVCNCNFKKKSLHSDNVHICKTTVCSNARHVNVSPCWMFSISLSHKPRVTASFVHWVSSSILSGYFACC